MALNYADKDFDHRDMSQRQFRQLLGVTQSALQALEDIKKMQDRAPNGRSRISITSKIVYHILGNILDRAEEQGICLTAKQTSTQPQHLDPAGKANAPQTNKQASQLNQ
jgi:hypothetical protein